MDASAPPPAPSSSARSAPRPKALVVVGVLVALFVCGVAAKALVTQLQDVSLAALRDAASVMPMWQLGAAAALVVVSYAWLSLYDRIGLAVSNKKPAGGRIASTAFIAYAVGKTFGFTALTAGFVRLRRYKHAGFGVGDLARLIVMTGSSAWLGFAVVVGSLLVAAPSPALPIAVAGQRAGGLALLALACAWLVVAARGLPAVTLRGFTFRMPSLRIALAQVAVGTVDWVLLSSVLWMLLPAGPSLPEVALAVGAAQIVSVASRVPGGAGVLEATLLLLLGSQLETAALAASLVAFRVLYYLTPLALAGAYVAVEAAVKKRVGRATATAALAPVAVPSSPGFEAGALTAALEPGR